MKRSGTPKWYGGNLLPPFLATIQAPNKDCHRFIRRSCLHLPILRLRLPAALALEHIRPTLLVALQHRVLPLRLFVRQRLPVFRIQLLRRHERNLMRRELSLLQPLNEPLVANVGLRVQIHHGAPCNHLVQIRKVRILPVLPDTLDIRILQGRIVDPPLQIHPLRRVQQRAEVFVNNAGDMRTKGHRVLAINSKIY